MANSKELEAWFVTGSQHLYGEAALRDIAATNGEPAHTSGRQE